MATEERLPPACAFAVSVLAEYNQDPYMVPEEAVEAAQQHMVTCARCVASQAPQTPTANSTLRKKKRLRPIANNGEDSQSTMQTLLEERPSAPEQVSVGPEYPLATQRSLITSPPPEEIGVTREISVTAQPVEDVLDCQPYRPFLSEYADALMDGQPAAMLYPEVHAHLQNCEMGCLALLDLFQQEAKTNRKNKRKPVRDPFSAIGWELSGFFRAGQVPMSPKALAYGTLMLLLIVAFLGALMGSSWNESHYHVPAATIPTPDGVGLSDGLKIFDACNAPAYQAKRDAAQEMHQTTSTKADGLLTSALHSTQSDASGCNGGEAAIYQEDLHVRQSGRPFGMVVVSFDSAAGDANPTGGSDRHLLYAAHTQELVGVSIAQNQYNTAQMSVPGAPLLYLVLANTTGLESGASQIANMIASLDQSTDYQQLGLLVNHTHPLLAVLGLGPDNLLQSSLPTMCRIGIPVIAPTIADPVIFDQLTETSLYNHCAPGFGFARVAADDRQQSTLGASYAYTKLKAKSAAVIYNPNDLSSSTATQGFIDNFSKNPNAHIVARETTITSDGVAGGSTQAQRVREDVSAALDDALKAKPRPDVIFASVQTSDAYTLAQAIARLPQSQQPTLIISGESLQPKALQTLAQWAHENQLTQPHIYVSVAAATQSKVTEEWQKQFYASFCTSFAPSGSSCSSAGALDQGALLFADGLESIIKGIGQVTDPTRLPTREELIQKIKAVQFNGVSSSIAFHSTANSLLTNQKAAPVLLNVQDDGSIQSVK